MRPTNPIARLPALWRGKVVARVAFLLVVSAVVAALAARGETTIRQIAHLDRGYEELEEKLRLVGANVTRLAYEPVTERRAA